MNPIKDLKAEHQAVLLTLKILDKINKMIAETGKAPQLDHMEQLLEFFAVFVDKCHHGKEEDLLFPALEQIGVSKQNGPIGAMLYEHQLGRTYVKNMKSALAAYQKGDREELNKFLQNAKGFITLLTDHIYKEDNVLYPLAENNLSPERQTELSEGFERIEVEKIGAGRHDEFHKLLDKLEETYLQHP